MVRIFPNREACLRLVTALAVEQSEEWLTNWRYVNMEELREHRRLEEREAEEAMLMERSRRGTVWRNLQKPQDLPREAVESRINKAIPRTHQEGLEHMGSNS